MMRTTAASLQPTPYRYVERRALALWPRLDRTALRRCRGDIDRIAQLVGRRTTLPPEAIRMMLAMPEVTDIEVMTWFG
jgi:hypothetical protein